MNVLSGTTDRWLGRNPLVTKDWGLLLFTAQKEMNLHEDKYGSFD